MVALIHVHESFKCGQYILFCCASVSTAHPKSSKAALLIFLSFFFSLHFSAVASISRESGETQHFPTPTCQYQRRIAVTFVAYMFLRHKVLCSTSISHRITLVLQSPRA